MVRKVISLCALLAIMCAFSAIPQASAAEYVAYDGNISNTYVTYFKDIIGGLPFNDHYVGFRSGQYEYVLVTGDITYDHMDGVFTGKGVTVYTFSSDGGNNSNYTYKYITEESFLLGHLNRIVYSDLGQFPQLETRGEKYEILSSVLIVVLLLGLVIYCIFKPR